MEEQRALVPNIVVPNIDVSDKLISLFTFHCSINSHWHEKCGHAYEAYIVYLLMRVGFRMTPILPIGTDDTYWHEWHFLVGIEYKPIRNVVRSQTLAKNRKGESIDLHCEISISYRPIQQ
jgi:hypothetical protein